LEKINGTSLAGLGGYTMLNDLVRSYLVHNGYSETARVFSRASGRQQEQDEMQLDEDLSTQLLSIKNRQGLLH